MEEPIALPHTVGIANLPELAPDTWPEYFKQVPTRMVRVAGPFTVLVHGDEGGEIKCQDGFLAVDARGYPYPISADEHALIYGTQKRLDVASLPPTSLQEIAVAHSYGILEKDVASKSARKLLSMWGLLDENAPAPA